MSLSPDNPVTPPCSPPASAAVAAFQFPSRGHSSAIIDRDESETERSTPESSPRVSSRIGPSLSGGTIPSKFTESPREPVKRRGRRSESGRRSRGSMSSGSSMAASILTCNSPTAISWNATSHLYANLLVLEESLRTQYVKQRLIRRKYSLFYFSLIALIIYLAYCQLFNPSPYRYLYIFSTLALVSAFITFGIFHLMGLYTKLIVHPKKFLLYTNKGIRTFNVKMVRVPSSWKQTVFKLLRHRSYRYRGGDLVKLVLIPRAFSSDVREGWEIYRQEYWDRENHRRVVQGGVTRQRTASMASSSSTTPAIIVTTATTGTGAMATMGATAKSLGLSPGKRRSHRPSFNNGSNLADDSARPRRKPSATLRP
ncbi:Spo7-domain-containing protein [Nadsonia fulvescens var. elongata DSM 6958]|uniref:Spo7-domain-containing protein n=1 Tax=Nadsonia fulvescens var. elongata DSM 6958 TaxID=857566 RepID=A0A1E3PJK6_9ASCO|nr:Spo7-domain-containing protein [Nadsonia fulvescens var. elongata DSM 6958]